jgi:hypothetical protein
MLLKFRAPTVSRIGGRSSSAVNVSTARGDAAYFLAHLTEWANI